MQLRKLISSQRQIEWHGIVDSRPLGQTHSSHWNAAICDFPPEMSPKRRIEKHEWLVVQSVECVESVESIEYVESINFLKSDETVAKLWNTIAGFDRMIHRFFLNIYESSMW